MSKATEAIKYCESLSDMEITYLKQQLEHVTENKRIYNVLPDIRIVKNYVIKEVNKRGLEND